MSTPSSPIRPTPRRESTVSHAEIADPAHDLSARQAALVEALVAGGPVPPGFDVSRIDATRRALLRKRAGEAAKQWPLLAAALGERWTSAFADHHAGRESGGGLRDGWDLARALRAELPPGAAAELAEREAMLRYDDDSGSLRPRRFARLRRASRR